MKRHLVLVALTLLVGLAWAGTAAAQVVFSASNASRTIRVEGLTEAVGPVVLTATTSGSVVSGTAFKITYGTASIANADGIASQTSGSTSGPVNCTASGCNGRITMAGTTSSFVDIEFTSDQTFNVGDKISIFEVRVSGNALGCGVRETAAVSVVNPIADAARHLITFVGPTSDLEVAKVFPGPNSAPSGCSSTTVTVTPQAKDLKTCVLKAQADEGFGGADLAVAITENFAEALTSRTDENNLGDCNHSDCGGADNGSEIRVTFLNLPAGTDISFTGQKASTEATVTLIGRLKTDGCVLDGGTGIKNDAGPGPCDASFIFSVNSGDNISDAFTLDLGFSTSNDTGSADPGTITTAVDLVPQLEDVVVKFAADTLSSTPGSTLTGPSVQAISGSSTAFAVDNCRTNLLFPFVANTLGFDTGIAIANTTLSPWTDATLIGKTISKPGSTDKEPKAEPPSPEHGNCILNLFPSTAGGFAGSPVAGASIAGTTPDIPAGGTWADNLSDPAGPFGGKQGYIIAVCDFEFAHGFAFITAPFPNPGTLAIAEGYLALVIPDPTTLGFRTVKRLPSGVPFGEGLNQ